MQSYPTAPTGRPYLPNGPSTTGGPQVYLPLCEGSRKLNRTGHPHGASLSPRQPRQDQRDSGVSTTAWRGVGSAIIPDPPPPPPGRPYTPNGPGRTGGTRVYPPLCGEELETGTYTAPPGASLSPKRPTRDWRDRGASAAMWGRAEKSIILDPPDGTLLSPKRPGQDRRDSGVFAAVWGRTWKSNHTRPPTGPPYPQRPQAASEGLG